MSRLNGRLRREQPLATQRLACKLSSVAWGAATGAVRSVNRTAVSVAAPRADGVLEKPRRQFLIEVEVCVVASNAWAPELVGRVGWILVSGRITLRHTHGDGLLQREIQPGQSLNRISDSQCLIGWFQALVLRRHACSLASRGLRPGEPSPLRDRLGWPYALPHTWPPGRMQGCGDAGLYPVYKPASR